MICDRRPSFVCRLAPPPNARGRAYFKLVCLKTRAGLALRPDSWMTREAADEDEEDGDGDEEEEEEEEAMDENPPAMDV